MAIEETITIDAGPAIGELDALASAAEGAAAKIDAAFKSIKTPSLGGSGAGNMARSLDAAAAKVEAAVAKIEASFARLGGVGAGAADSLAAVGRVASASAAGVTRLADAEKAAADAGARVSKSSTTAADGIKGLGDSTKKSSAWLDEYNATMAETAAAQKDYAAVSADANAKIAMGQRLNTAASRDASATAVAAQKAQVRASTEAAAAAETSSKKHSTAILGIAAAAAYGIYQAGQLQAGVTRLYTTAGESQKNLPMITAAIPQLAGQTATSQKDLLSGAYMVESAGFHGRNALGVLKAAAQGAYAEGAPLGETGNALTSLLNAYGLKKGVPVQQQATSAMNQIIAMVSGGKMTMAGAVSALPSVLPIAAASKLSFSQVGGALGTMTSMGMSPDQAAQNLAHTIGSLANPSHVQTLEMQQLGIDSVKLSKNLGKEGLTGAISQVETGIMRNMGPAGTVLLKSFNASKLAAASATQEIAAMPAPLQHAAKAYLDGSTSAKAWRTELQGLPAIQGNILKQFASTADAAHGFNSELKAGGGNAQTFQAALAKAMGGQVGRNTALMLGGASMGGFQARAGDIAAAGAAGTDVAGWKTIQGTFNFQLKSFEQTANAALTTVGTALLPAATGAMKVLAGAGSFLAGHPELTKDLAIGGGVLGAGYAFQRVSKPAVTALQGVGKIAETLHIPGLDKLANLGKDSGLTASATALDGAATSLEGAAASLKGAAGVSEESGALGAGGKGAGAAEGEAAGASAVSKARSAFGTAVATTAAAWAVGHVVGAFLPKATKSDQQQYRQNTPGWLQAPADFVFGDKAASVYAHAPARNSWEAIALGGVAGTSATQGQNWANWYHNVLGGGRPASSAAPPAKYADGTPFYGEVPGKSAPLPARHAGAIPEFWDNTVKGFSGLFSSRPAAAPAPQTPEENVRFGTGAVSAGPVIKPKIGAPDTSAVTAAAGHVKSIMDGALSSVSGKKPKIQAPDMSALDSAKGKAQAAGTAITSALTGAFGKPAKLPPPDLSAASAAAGKARGIGSGISAGLASGILAGEGAVVAAATQVGNAAATAMAKGAATHSPSKKTIKTGHDLSAGIVVGLQGGQPAIDAAATAIGKSAAKAADISSIDNAAKKLLSEVPKGDTALTRMLKADTRDLERMANTRAKLEAEIANSEQVAKSVIGNASITSALNAVNPAGNEPIASSAVVTGQGYQASTLKQFAASLKQLQGMGLNATALSQLAQGDPSQELPVAQGIASGGKQAVRQLNQLQKQMQSSAAAIGNIAGPAMYQAGKDVGQGLAAGLKSELGSLDKAMEHLAKSMVASVQHHTKTAKKAAHKTAAGTTADAAAAAAGSLPASGAAASRAAARTGKDSLSVAAASLSQAGASLSGAATALNSAAAALNKAAAGGGPGGTPHAPVTHPGARAGARPLSGPSGGGYGGGGAGPAGYQPSFGIGSGGTHYHQHVNVTVHGSVMAQNDLMDTVQSGLVTRGINNWQTGIIPPGRAG